MFTGLIQGQGTLLSLQSQGQDMRLNIKAHFPLPDIIQGESIAVNGVCLTVENGNNNSFTAYVSAQSLSCTNLKFLRQGNKVNLERALALGQRLGGHIVSGHVDCLANVNSITSIGQSRCISLDFPVAYSPEIINKGSITLDGISLTINNCGLSEHKDRAFLEVNVIPETWSVTTIGKWIVGAQVNLETDIIGKYVRHMLTPYQSNLVKQEQNNKNSITLNLLQEHGFL